MSATTDVEICNGALGRLGVEGITALTDPNPRARLCNTLYDKRRDSLLRKHPWNFAMKRAQLILADSTAPAYKYANRYELPADCLLIREVSDGANSDYEWEVEGGFLVTNLTDPYIRYTAKITDVEKYDACFSETLSVDLAHEMAMALTGSAERKKELKEDLKEELRTARSMDAFESSVPRVEANTWLNARY